MSGWYRTEFAPAQLRRNPAIINRKQDSAAATQYQRRDDTSDNSTPLPH